MTKNRLINIPNPITNNENELDRTMTSKPHENDRTTHHGVTANALSGWYRSHYRGGFNGDPHVAAMNALLDKTGVLDKLTAWRDEDARAAGTTTRVAFIPERAILVGLLILSDEGAPLLISRLADLFQYRLSVASRNLLGLPATNETGADSVREERRWRNNTHRAFHRMLALMDPFPEGRARAHSYTEVQKILMAHDPEQEKIMKGRLNEFTHAFLTMTYMEQPESIRQATPARKIILDQSPIESPLRKGFTKSDLEQRATNESKTDGWRREAGPVEVFAGWLIESEPHGPGTADSTETARNDPRKARSGRPIWGWEANIALGIDSKNSSGARPPLLAVGATLRIPGDRKSDDRLTRAARNANFPSAYVDRVAIEAFIARLRRRSPEGSLTAGQKMGGLAAAQLAVTIQLATHNLRTIDAFERAESDGSTTAKTVRSRRRDHTFPSSTLYAIPTDSALPRM